ncbi:DUF2256 domain-containing protein [Rubrivirga litoralis]|uniref:DUF2256 domain-containing protein n=1 Tax=Rubrivirga litoralis TaxID=3075598 RepID=A0ABU3BLY2_9BACT|nr:DUF2256 domain-containing protein [Rubrivirga sp. F394]MDT0630280.1 DUF2256 domain-containing protein [Rubrivirga sp. F394]
MAHHKPTLPTKTCAVCGRPFAWRRKWARDWESVRYCSERCRRAKGSAGRRGDGRGGAAQPGPPGA